MLTERQTSKQIHETTKNVPDRLPDEIEKCGDLHIKTKRMGLYNNIEVSTRKKEVKVVERDTKKEDYVTYNT